MILLVDNYDSFTYNLLDYLEQLGASCKVIRNDEYSLSEIIAMEPEAIVISPGPGRPAESGILAELIAYYHDKLPLLGICLGHQAIGEYYGARLQKAAQPMHGKTSVIRHNGHPMFSGIPENMEVMRYHSLILENVPAPLLVTARTAGSEIMAMAHPVLPIWSFQFHPESVLTAFGLTLINNWLSLIKS